MKASIILNWCPIKTSQENKQNTIGFRMLQKLEVNFDVDARKGDELAVAKSELSDGKQNLTFSQAERAENEHRINH